MDKKRIIGIGIFVLLLAAIIGIKFFLDSKDNNDPDKVDLSKLTTVYVATGGGKEDFLADERVVKILREKYKINAVFDNWSNGKTVLWPLYREYAKYGDPTIIKNIENGQTYSLHSQEVTPYDALFTSDQRFYDYYKLRPNTEAGEAERFSVLDGGLTLNTPIVIYSWKDVVESLMKEGIVTKDEEGVHYISDMNKLIEYILDGKKWQDVNLPDLYGNINISSTDLVTSSPGATYYGLLLSILGENQITDSSIKENLPKLKEFYIKSGYMNNTPADLFQSYLMTGMGGKPMIVDYEKSIIEFANEQPDKFAQVKDDIIILYPKPTIWNSHCFAAFTENGKKLYEAFNDSEIQQIAWEKYGFRTGVTGGKYDVSSFGIAIPQKITSTVTSLKMDYYNQLIDYLK